MASDLAGMRDDYDTSGLEPGDLGGDPMDAARRWFDDAIAAGVPQPNAMSLATATATGLSSVRTVLLKAIDDGFVWYTSYASRKGRELEANPRAAISLTWVTMHRQLRAEGTVGRLTTSASDAYFVSRPRGAQIAAVASSQSEPVDDRRALEERFSAVAATVGEDPVARPPHWGGYRLVADRIEFWQGRRDRMHDRIEFGRDGTRWSIRRLSP